MSDQQVLSVFKTLIDESSQPFIFSFQRFDAKNQDTASPFVEVIQNDLQGKIRKFELDFEKCQSIIDHFNLPKKETAVVFENGKTFKKLHGFKNVRNYLRTFSTKN
ncbi:MAG: hypothetical protein ACD_79C00414G0002 [uncultured bacterium]|nr:MAG: hypothetical protein ACD_79C00414G0002 [uncultured bacterium]